MTVNGDTSGASVDCHEQYVDLDCCNVVNVNH